MTPLQEITMKLAKDAGFSPCLDCETPAPKGKEFCDSQCERRYMSSLNKEGKR